MSRFDVRMVSDEFELAEVTMNATLKNMIEKADAKIGVIGMGYVGLPLAIAFAEKGFSVTGFDVDETKVRAIHSGPRYIKHMDWSRVECAAASGKLSATSDFSLLDRPDVLLICVPTPLTPQREPDMTFIQTTSRQIRDSLRRGQLVVLESTTYPGTTDELVRSILEESGLKAGTDFFLAFSPEREDPGNLSFGTTNTPKVVGGFDPASGDLAEALYSRAIEKTVRVSDSRTAEAVKLTENVFRAVNIALVNELKVIYQRMGIDIWEVLDAAATKPFGFMRFNPGPGWGGHCIPLDPFYLSWKARESGESPKFIELAGDINLQMPRYVVRQLMLALNEREKPMRNSKVLVLGLAYKKDIDDPRESPAFEVIHLLLELGVLVSYHDPHIPEAPRMRSWPGLPVMKSLPLTGETLQHHDAVVVVTDHSAVDYTLVLHNADLVVDTRGVYRSVYPNVIKA